MVIGAVIEHVHGVLLEWSICARGRGDQQDIRRAVRR